MPNVTQKSRRKGISVRRISIIIWLILSQLYCAGALFFMYWVWFVAHLIPLGRWEIEAQKNFDTTMNIFGYLLVVYFAIMVIASIGSWYFFSKRKFLPLLISSVFPVLLITLSFLVFLLS